MLPKASSPPEGRGPVQGRGPVGARAGGGRERLRPVQLLRPVERLHPLELLQVSRRLERRRPHLQAAQAPAGPLGRQPHPPNRRPHRPRAQTHMPFQPGQVMTSLICTCAGRQPTGRARGRPGPDGEQGAVRGGPAEHLQEVRATVRGIQERARLDGHGGTGVLRLRLSQSSQDKAQEHEDLRGEV